MRTLNTRSLSVVNVTPFLPSTGLGYRRATLHHYSHSAPLTLRNGSKTITGLAHYFKCSETGEVRQWGFDTTFEGN